MQLAVECEPQQGYWPTQSGMEANNDEIIKCQALGMLTNSYSHHLYDVLILFFF